MNTNRLPLAVYFGLVVLFLLIPLLVVVPISFVDSQFLQFPPEEFSLRWYRRFFTDPDFVSATQLSIIVGIGASSIATVIGTMASVVLTRRRFFGRSAFIGTALSPMIVPVIIFALGAYFVLAKLDLLGSVMALILIHSMLALPFSIMIVSASLEQSDETLERAARVLGAGPFAAFFYVTLPSIRSAVFAAAVFGFFISFDDLVIALFVMGRDFTLPVRIWQDLRFEIDPTIAATASMLIFMAAVGMALGSFFHFKAKKQSSSLIADKEAY